VRTAFFEKAMAARQLTSSKTLASYSGPISFLAATE